MSVSLRAALVSRARRVAGEFWAYVLLSLLLTTIISVVRELSDPARLSVLFVANLVLSACIGASCELGALCSRSCRRASKR